VLFAAYRDPSPESMRRLVEVMTYDSKFADGELAERRSESARKTQVHLETSRRRASRPRRHLHQ